MDVLVRRVPRSLSNSVAAHVSLGRIITQEQVLPVLSVIHAHGPAALLRAHLWLHRGPLYLDDKGRTCESWKRNVAATYQPHSEIFLKGSGKGNSPTLCARKSHQR